MSAAAGGAQGGGEDQQATGKTPEVSADDDDGDSDEEVRWMDEDYRDSDIAFLTMELGRNIKSKLSKTAFIHGYTSMLHGNPKGPISIKFGSQKAPK